MRVPTDGPTTGGLLPGDFTTVEPSSGLGWKVTEKLGPSPANPCAEIGYPARCLTDPVVLHNVDRPSVGMSSMFSSGTIHRISDIPDQLAALQASTAI